MKTQKVESYTPKYARIVKGAAITVAAAAMLSGVAGCTQPDPDELTIDGLISYQTPVPDPTEDVTETGYIDIENTPDPGELRLDGEVAIDEPEDVCTDDDLTLSGAISYADPNDSNED